MQFESYIQQKKNQYQDILNFLEDESQDVSTSQEMCNTIKQFFSSLQKNEMQEELTIFLHLIISISDNHFRNTNFNIKIDKFLLHFSDEIKQTLSNCEIYKISKNSKRILLLFLKNNIITFNEKIVNDLKEPLYFYPEIKDLISESEREKMEKDLLSLDSQILDHFERNRQNSENNSYICQLIRQDSIEKFITHVNKVNLPINTLIKGSLFETNPFLIGKNPSLIEYATFYGAIQIFEYLISHGAELEPTIWMYAVHSNNAEIIYKLEQNNILPKNFESYLIESIKCHHNNIAEYIKTNLYSNQKMSEQEINDYIDGIGISYYNLHFLRNDLSNSSFYFLYQDGYHKLVNLFMDTKKEYLDTLKYNNEISKKKKNLNEVFNINFFNEIFQSTF